ncbi:hypothetical protein BDZ94DRAFT_1266355 [Collybia nuda]|uniref:Uncharacterized protein n=1 Tax=Collybia nuda TaxID=64659 RepID=A0A9P5XZ86_9AGAR|nr:hypothetical protein BDZ94DRAFT_1266355 [Collybia nuda]
MSLNILPSVESQAFRANLAQLVSPLRRVRPRVPFYDLAAHRIPTLWGLYRGLLREAPTDDILFRIKGLFRKHQHLTGTTRTIKQLSLGYKYLDAFKRANEGDEKLRAILLRYSQFIAHKREKAYWKQLALNEVAWQTRLRNRPILTGGYMRPSASNGPLPRMKPQPHLITSMILKRRRAKVRRVARLAQLRETFNFLRGEIKSERELVRLVGDTHPFDPVFANSYAEWVEPIDNARSEIQEAFARTDEMAETPYPPEMLERIKQAQLEKLANKTRERERERRGEILRRTISRQNAGPPAPVLAKMTPEQRKMDKVARSVSEVGYVAQVKRKLGFKLRDPNAWKKENGSPENKKALDRIARDIMWENLKRQRVKADVSNSQV